MSTLYCAKQAAAMAEYATDKARATLDDAIDREELREELIAARKQEIVAKRIAEMEPIDIVAGMQFILEEGMAPMIRRAILANDNEMVGIYTRSLINLYIEEDSHEMARTWLKKIDEESKWGE